MALPDYPTAPNTPSLPEPGRATGLTAWLVFLIVLNALAAAVLPAIGAAVRSLSPPDPATDLILFAPTVLAVANIAFVIALFKYKKWGFWGMGATSLLFIPVLDKLGGGGGADLMAGAFGVIGIGLLHAALNAGDDDQKAWPRLR